MKRRVNVCLGDEARPVGVLHFEREGARERAAFEYDESWLGAPDGFALEPALPLVSGPQFHRQARDGSLFHAVIADTEPDGWGRRIILREQAKRFELARRASGTWSSAPLDHLDLLLEPHDVLRLGALRFQSEDGAFGRGERDTAAGGLPPRRVPPLSELPGLVAATRAFDTNSETPDELAYLRERAPAVGGMRPKCTLVDENGASFIAKFPSSADAYAVTKAEVLALELARAAGIRVAEARLVQCDGVAVALIRRFDRDPGGRVHYASAATLLGAERSEPGAPSYTSLAEVLRTHGADPQPDLEELWRRIAFSILITNVDDHLLNHGFLHAGRGKWRLSPAFDLNPFPDRRRELKTWISPQAGPGASIDALLSVAPHFDLGPGLAREILGRVEHAVSGWQAAGHALGMSRAELEPFEAAFEHAERLVARGM